MFRPVVFVSVALGLAACSSDAVDPKARALADAICPKAHRCCESGDLAGNDWAGDSVEACRSKTASGFDGEFARVRASEKKGRSRFIPARVDACIASITGASCDALNVTDHFSGVTGCDGFVDPLVPPGGQCSNDAECINGRCEIPESKAVGICEALATSTQACLVSDDCARNLLCHEATMTCYVPKPAGEVCAFDRDCASFNCMTNNSGEKYCAAPPSDQCFYASACSFGRARPGLMALLLVGLSLAWARRRRRA